MENTTPAPAGRVTLTRAVVLSAAWTVYLGTFWLPLQLPWFLLQRFILKDATARLTIWKPNFRKARKPRPVDGNGNPQPRTITDIIGLVLFGWIYAALRIIRK